MPKEDPALKGRTILFLGSSVTCGSEAGGVSFVDLLAEETGCRTVKEAVSGTTLADRGPDSYVSRMKRLLRQPHADLFVCQLSTNDAAQGIPPDETFAALGEIIGRARRAWRCPAAVYTSPRWPSAAYAELVARLNAGAEAMGIYVIDLWNDDAFNRATDGHRREWMTDEIHPTLRGYREGWTPYFRAALAALPAWNAEN